VVCREEREREREKKERRERERERERHHEKLLIPATGIQFIPVCSTGIWHARENKFHTRESLFIFPCAPREYEY
jgi:hypothetical protein